MITLPRIVEVSLPHRAFFVLASASGHVVAASAEGRVSVLGQHLVLVAQLEVGRKVDDIAISPAGDLLAICGDGSLSLIRTAEGREEWTVPIGHGGAAGFDHGGALLWSLDLEDAEKVTVRIRDVRDGRVLREGHFTPPSTALGCSLHPQPRSGAVAIWAAAGQDGQWVLLAHDDGEAIAIAQVEGISESIPPCFDADGSAFLTTTFDSVTRWSLPEATCTAAVRAWPWSESDEDSVGSSVAWAGAHGALVTTSENRLFLVDLESGRVVDEVVVDGHPLRPMGEVYSALDGESGLTSDVERVISVGANRVLTVGGGPESSRLVLADTTALRAAGFWSWFASNEERFRRMLGPETDLLLDEILSRLHDYCPRLFFQMGGAPEGPIELIVTSEGDRAFFSAVSALVEAAPALSGWCFIAFMPPAGFAFMTEYRGVTVDPAACWFLPLVSETDPRRFAVRVAVPGYEADRDGVFCFAVGVALRTGLGELTFANAIDAFDVEALPASPETEGYIELGDLPRYLEYRAKGITTGTA